MERSRQIIYCILAFLSGILLSEFIFSLGTAVFLVFAVLFFAGCLFRKWFCVVTLLMFFAGAAYFDMRILRPDDESGVKYFLGLNVEWQVEVDAEVDIRRTGQKLIVKPDGPKGRFLLDLPKYPRYEYGDRLFVKGLLEEPFETEEFSYKRYLERYEVYGVMKNPKVQVLSGALRNPFYKGVFFVKGLIQERINFLWAEPYASFESGLLIGARKGIPDEIMGAFNTTGLTHIIAISGYNISLVIILVGAVFAGISRKRRVVLSVLFIAAFVVLAGMSAAVVRAAIMGSIGLAAVYFGRSTRVTLTLLMSALLMNLWNPKILPLDTGFQLSFAATCGIVYVSPKIEKWFAWCPALLGIREGLQMTIAAQISTLPIILFHFGRLSLVSPLANILVTPFIPLSMASGAIAFLLSLFSDFLGKAAAGVTWIFLEIIIKVIFLCAKIPFASLEIGDFGLPFLIGSYVFLWMWLRE